MGVDPAGQHEAFLCVDLLVPTPEVPPDRLDPAVPDANIALEGLERGYDGPAANYEVEFTFAHWNPPCTYWYVADLRTSCIVRTNGASLHSAADSGGNSAPDGVPGRRQNSRWRNDRWGLADALQLLGRGRVGAHIRPLLDPHHGSDEPSNYFAFAQSPHAVRLWRVRGG
jgi:hypothetical protein